MNSRSSEPPARAAPVAATAEPASGGALAPAHAEALVRVVEAGPQVRRRYHFFIWTQGALQQLLPHSLAVCGAYQRNTRELAFEAFHSIAVPQPVLDRLCQPRSALQLGAQAAWVAARGQATVLRLDAEAPAAEAAERAALLDAGYLQLLVHGVARPQRATEIESFFLLASPNRKVAGLELLYLDLLLPHLHAAYLRVQAVEREMGMAAAVPRQREAGAGATGITAREAQILRWVRDGKSNQQIGEVLDISPLTVKNHIQKILRKLGAANRAQAVAHALALKLIVDSDVDQHAR